MLTHPSPVPHPHRGEACLASVKAVKDALYVLSGKWKLPLILALTNGPLRFKEIERALGEITPKILSKELKELEQNEFVERKVFATTPVTVLYQLTPYSQSLDKVLEELRNWGMQHRQRIMHGQKETAGEESPAEAPLAGA
jgi:DNA-binding HxlR family transcriptional regulator